MKKLISAFFAVIILSIAAYGQIIDTNMYFPNGYVNAIVTSGDTVFIGGNFTRLGKYTGSGPIVNATTGDAEPNFPIVEGTIYACVSDSNGGWFIGGVFSKVGGIAIKNLAHINPDNTLNASWKPNPDGGISTIYLSQNKLYVGGYFTSIGGQNRNNAAALDKTTGMATAWKPNPNNSVNVVYPYGAYVYLGGPFTTVGGVTRNALTAVDTTTGLATSWSPNPSCSNCQKNINSIAIKGNTLFTGGNFTTIGGNSRQGLAGIDLTTGLATSFNADVNNGTNAAFIYSMAISGDSLYIAGNFTLVKGQTRPNLASILISSSTVTSFNPNIDVVQKILKVGNILYAGGGFRKAGSELRFSAAAYDLTTLTLTPWNPDPSAASIVYAFAQYNDRVYIGGNIVTAGGIVRTGLAALNMNTGVPHSWTANVAGEVFSLALSENKLYVGGRFSTIGGQSRIDLAAVDKSSAVPTAFNADFSGIGGVNCISIHNGTIYIGGDFILINSQTRNNIASFNQSTGALTNWNPSATRTNPNTLGIVKVITMGDSTFFVGGAFDNIGGESRKGLAEFSLSSGLLSSWNPHNAINNYIVSGIALSDKHIFIGGDFLTLTGPQQNYLMQYDKKTRMRTLYSPQLNGSVSNIFYYGNTLYIAGNFNSVSNQERHKFAQIDPDGKATTWNPESYGDIYALTVSNGKVFTGGASAGFGNLKRHFLVSISAGYSLYHSIKGNLFLDKNSNCIKDTNETGLKDWIVKAEPGPFYGSTDDQGNYTIYTDSGNYSVNSIPPQFKIISNTCPATPHAISFTGYNLDTTNIDISNNVQNCSLLSIDIGSTRRRRCFRNVTTVTFCNKGLATASNVEVKVIYPEYVIPLSSSLPWSSKQDSVLTYNIGALASDECMSFVITDSVECNPNIRGFTACTKAIISPKSNCFTDDPAWDKSNINVMGQCKKDTVFFTIANEGSGNMADSSNYRVFINNILVYKGKFKLVSGKTLIVNVPANGNTIRLEADQHPHYPGMSMPRETIEGCGTNVGLISKGFVIPSPQDDADQEIEISCMEIRDSYDPNDKEIAPSGVSANKYVGKEEELEFTIHFQNTGSDTAYTVIVKDTLSASLDIASFRTDLSSHPFSLEITGKGKPVITWTFNSIMLPDSNTNKSKSMGFVKFHANQKSGNTNGTLINNSAFIYFDYNSPIITNEVSVMVWDTTISDLSLGTGITTNEIISGFKSFQSNISMNIYPNPLNQSAMFVVEGNSFQASASWSIILSDLNGKVCLKDIITQKHPISYELKRGNLPNGIYFYKILSENVIMGVGKIVIID